MRFMRNTVFYSSGFIIISLAFAFMSFFVKETGITSYTAVGFLMAFAIGYGVILSKKFENIKEIVVFGLVTSFYMPGMILAYSSILWIQINIYSGIGTGGGLTPVNVLTHYSNAYMVIAAFAFLICVSAYLVKFRGKKEHE